MFGSLLLLSTMGVVSAALNNNATSLVNPAAVDLTGTMVGARFRCEGLWCPQWALDVTRYDPIRKVNTPYTFDLAELLPLAPTAERSGYLRTAFDATTRIYTVAAADYPITGVDAVWTMKIGDDVTDAEVITQNILFKHPDASTNSPGSLQLIKVLPGPDSRTLAIFSCGGIHEMNTQTGEYSKIGSIFGEGSNVGYRVTDAHVTEGNSLKSFLYNELDGETYLVVTDISSSTTATPSPMVKVARPQGMRGALHAQAAHMYTIPGTTESRLMVLMIDSFDYFGLVDETTGEVELSVANIADSTSQLDIQCWDSTKECDLWQTSCVDPVSAQIFFQAHDVNPSVETETTVIGCMGYTTSVLQDTPYALSWTTIEPMEFGFYGYQWVPFVQ